MIDLNMLKLNIDVVFIRSLIGLQYILHIIFSSVVLFTTVVLN